MNFRNKHNISAPETQVSRPKRATAAGIGVLLTSALVLPGSMVALSADGGVAAKADPRVAGQAYWDRSDFQYLSGRLQALLATFGPLGATGALPRDSRPSPALVGHARNLAKLVGSGEPVLSGLAGDPAAMAELPPGPLGIPGILLRAYQRAQQIMSVQQPGCHLPWWLLAGIGEVESGQADGGLVDAQGNTLVAILGPALDGTNGTAAVPAFGGGWQRAMGPMQFLPSTWSIWGAGNANNVYDAALAAGRYLCAGGWNLSDPAQQVMAVFSYNHSDSYVQQVLAWAYAYAGGVTPLPLRLLSGYGPAAPRSPARPSRRPVRTSSSPGKSATSSPSHPRSSSPASPSSPSSSPTPAPKATRTPSPLPSLPSPLPSLPSSLPSLLPSLPPPLP